MRLITVKISEKGTVSIDRVCMTQGSTYTKKVSENVYDIVKIFEEQGLLEVLSAEAVNEGGFISTPYNVVEDVLDTQVSDVAQNSTESKVLEESNKNQEEIKTTKPKKRSK